MDPFAERMKPGFLFRDVLDFQQKYPTREEREKVLPTMAPEEITHIARTCGNVTGAAYYGRFAALARKKRERQEAEELEENAERFTNDTDQTDGSRSRE